MSTSDSVGGTTGSTPQHSRFDEESPPAVTPMEPSAAIAASTLVESPYRVVAVLDDAVVRAVAPVEPGDASETSRGRTWMLIGAAAIAALAAVVALALLLGNDSEPQLDATQADRVEDLLSGPDAEDLAAQEGEATDLAPEAASDASAEDQASVFGAVTDPATNFDVEESLAVGPLTVVNGVPLRDALAVWHRDWTESAGRAIVADQHTCWFGQFGIERAVQAVYCGPVGDSTEPDALFDAVPVTFEEVDDGHIALPLIDLISQNERLPEALELIE